MPGVLIRIRRWLRAGFDGSAADQPGSVYVARLVVVVILAGSGIAMLETEQSLWRDEEMAAAFRSEEHTSELQSLMRISYAVFCLKKKKNKNHMSSRDRNNKRITYL